MRPFRDTAIYHELEQVVATNLDRHLATSREWFPHDYVPWESARDFTRDPWRPEDSRLPEVAKTSLIVNLLTEDNLPSYHLGLATTFGARSAWGEWMRRWTAEEGRHSIVIRDYLVVTRGVDPIALERARMAQVTRGWTMPYDGDMLHGLAYVTFQELATRIAHRNTGRVAGDPVCDRMLSRIAQDENLHMVFYRDLLAAALELAPGPVMVAINDVVGSFQMPGSDLPDFRRKAMDIANAAIYDPHIHFEQVLQPVLRKLGVFEAADLTAEGERARADLDLTLARLERAANRFVERRESRRAGRPE